MATAADIKFILSGGAANTNPLLALGGAISTAAGGVVLSQSATASTIVGITYNDAAGNTIGTGLMTYTTAGTLLQWTPPGGAIGGAVNVTPSGDYTVYGADNLGHVKVTSVTGSLAGNATQNVTIANQTQALFENILVAESIAGDTDYRCFYVKNTHAADTASNFLLWINTDPVGADSIQIGLDPAGVNATATTIADMHTAPTGVTFSVPTNETNALSLGTMTFGQYYAVWMKRIVPAGITNGTPLDYSLLKGRFI